MPSPERLSDGIGAQVDDLHQVVSGAGEQLGAVVVQVQRRDSAQQLQLTHNGLRSDVRVKHGQCAERSQTSLCSDLQRSNAAAATCFRPVRLM